MSLRALGASGPVQWLLDGRLQGTSEGGQGIALALGPPGEHTITALSDRGAWSSLHVSVAAP